MCEEVGVVALVTQLSELYAAVRKGQDGGEGGSFRGHVFRETQREAVKARVSNYRRICFEYILKKKEFPTSRSSLSSRDRLYAEALRLSIAGQPGRSKQLIRLTDALLTEASVPHMDSVLKFILALVGEGGDGDEGEGFLDIGDNIHEARAEQVDEFSVKPYSQNFRFHARDSKRSGGRAKPAKFPLFTFKDFILPANNEDTGAKVSHVPSAFTPHLEKEDSSTKVEEDEVKDEGYSSPNPPKVGTEIWDDIWKVDLPNRRCWEGLRSKTTYWEGLGSKRWEPDQMMGDTLEKPFLSEAGGKSVHHLWQICMSNLRLVDPQHRQPALLVISEAKLCQDIGYILAGIETVSFPLNQHDRFEVQEGLCIEGLSPECVRSSCEIYVDVGNIFRHLDGIHVQEDSRGCRILFGFIQGVHRYLRVYSSAVIHMGWRIREIGKLHQALRPLLDQMRMLGSICKVEEDSKGWYGLPRGVDLLSLLLKVSVHICQDQANLILISLFKDAINPYFRFLKAWLYSGECDLSYREFGLLMDTRYGNIRSIEYWLYTYGLAQLSENGPAAAFLTEIQEKVFCAGKSMALLKLICPDHHLCGRFRDLEPEFRLAVTADEQASLRNSVEAYVEAATEAANRDTISLKEQRKIEEQARIQEAKRVQIRHEEAAEKVRQEIVAKRKETFAAQRAQYNALKAQAEQSRLHKETELKKRRREEEEIEAEAERLLEAQRAAEEEDRRRITEFYRRMEREAEDRERRAEWRIKRNNPSIKSRRILLHREISETQESRLRRLESTKLSNQTTEAKDHVVNEPSTVSISDVQITKDEMGNLTARFKDAEGNWVTDNLEHLSQLEDSGLQNQLSSRPFELLPDNVRNQIIQALEFRLSDLQSSQPNLSSSPLQSQSTRSQTPASVRQDANKTSIADYLRQEGLDAFQDRNGNLDDVDAVVTSTTTVMEVVGERKKSASLPIERILYPHRYYTQKDEEAKAEETKIVLKKISKPLPYTKTFPQLTTPPSQQEAMEPVSVLETSDFPPLGLILQNSILVPLRAQKKLVDSALLNHLLVDSKLSQHFSALRRYLLLADGEFGRQLVISLCQLGRQIQEPASLAGQIRQHLVDGSPPPVLLCPTVLNRVLESAITASLQGLNDPLAHNLSFTLKETTASSTMAERNLGIPGLSLSYRTTWPANIVLSEEVLSKYSRVVDFMLSLRTCLVSLELDWAQENLVMRSKKKEVEPRLHRVNIIRHEMLNFVRNLYSYVSTQVLEVSWLEFQDNLTNKVTCLDDLIHYHTKYLNRVLFRCLLNLKAAPVMKIITSILVSINIFSSLIGRSGDVSEEAWEEMSKQYHTFKKTSKFLFGCVTKLSSRGYQPHFQDLLMRLNFNGFYETSLDVSSVSKL